MAGIKDILKLSSMVMALVPPAAPFAAIVAGAAAVIPEGDDDDDEEEREWKVSRIAGWTRMVRELMAQPMNNEVRARTLKDRIRADYYARYAEMPKDRYVDKLHSDLVFVVKARAATELSA